MSAIFDNRLVQRLLLVLAASSIVALCGLSLLEFRFMQHHQEELALIDSAHHRERTAAEIKKWLRVALSARHAFVITEDSVQIETLENAREALLSLLPELIAQDFSRRDHIASEIEEFLLTLRLSTELRRQSPEAFNEQLLVTYEGEEHLSLINEDLDLDQISWAADALDSHLAAGAWRSKLETLEKISISVVVLAVIFSELALFIEVRFRRRAEYRLKRLLTEPMSLLESHPLPVVVRGRDDATILWNNEMHNELQYSIDETAEGEIVPETPESVERLRKIRRQALHGAGIGKVEIKAHRADGSLFEAIATVSSYRDEEGSIQGTVTVYGDVSALKKNARERVASVLNQRDLLVREVNHTVKNSLQGVANLIQLQLANRSELVDVQKKISSQLRAIAAIHGLRSKLNDSLEVGVLLQEIVEIVALSFGTSIELVNKIEDSGKVIATSETIPVTLVVTELLINALKHSSAKNADRLRPTVTVSDVGSSVRIQILNEGHLSRDLHIVDGVGLGEGLKLCLALLPADYADFGLSARDGRVSAVLILKPSLFYSPMVEERVA